MKHWLFCRRSGRASLGYWLFIYDNDLLHDTQSCFPSYMAYLQLVDTSNMAFSLVRFSKERYSCTQYSQSMHSEERNLITRQGIIYIISIFQAILLLCSLGILFRHTPHPHFVYFFNSIPLASCSIVHFTPLSIPSHRPTSGLYPILCFAFLQS